MLEEILVEKDLVGNIFLTVVLGSLGLVFFSHIPLLHNCRNIFIAILTLNLVLVVLKIFYPPIFTRAIWMLSWWVAVLLIIISFATSGLMVSAHEKIKSHF